MKHLLAVALCAALPVALAGCRFHINVPEAETETTASPAYVTDIHGKDVPVFEDVALSSLDPTRFRKTDNGRMTYDDENYNVYTGIDVSRFQGDVDWDAVKADGVDFVMLRIGGRAYGTEGELYEDTKFPENYAGARAAGLQVGVYFYSQAVSEEEAREEAQFVLDALQNRALDLPIVFDWEKIDNEDADIARTNGLGMERRTDCAVAFCEAIREGGYDASVYFNRNLGYYGYDLRRLTDYDFWFALPIAPPELYWPSFYYKVNIWQYSFTDTVPGIEGETDMNMMFIPVSQG